MRASPLVTSGAVTPGLVTGAQHQHCSLLPMGRMQQHSYVDAARAPGFPTDFSPRSRAPSTGGCVCTQSRESS